MSYFMKKRVLWIILLAAIVCFIWGNSVLPPDVSKSISSAVADWLSFGSGGSGEGISQFGLRKIGHFLEFAALGIVGAMLIRTYHLDMPLRITVTALSAFFFSVFDETIQLFNGRGSSVADVWIDIGGFAFGSLLVCVFLYLMKKRKSVSKNDNNHDI